MEKSKFKILVHFYSCLLNFVMFHINELVSHLCLKLFLIHNSFEEHSVLVLQTGILFRQKALNFVFIVRYLAFWKLLNLFKSLKIGPYFFKEHHIILYKHCSQVKKILRNFRNLAFFRLIFQIIIICINKSFVKLFRSFWEPILANFGLFLSESDLLSKKLCNLRSWSQIF